MTRLDDRRTWLLGRIPVWYRGWVHFALVNLLGTAVVLVCLSSLSEPDWTVAAFVPAFFVFANFFEWWIHRGPLHRRTPPLGILYDRHSGAHHVVFAGDRMEIAHSRELIYVLFPWYVLPLLVLLTSPLTLALWLVDRNLAWAFLASAIAYYLVYEWLHLLHHMPRDSWIGRRSWVRVLRRHHWRHHEPERMNEGNFNVSFPLADWILGSTLRRGRGGRES